MSEVNMGTLYDINKVAIEKEGALNRPTFLNKIKEVEKYFREKITTKNHYFMLLCNELKDYTVFNITEKSQKEKLYETTNILIDECLKNRGEIRGIDLTKTQDAIEIWMVIEDEAYVYYFFPYDAAIIEV